MQATTGVLNFSALATNDDWSFREESRANTTALTHSYHRYPAKFIPQIVDKLIKDYTQEGDLVVDPFGGCGTTLVEAKLNGRKSIGFDINPIAKLITQTKITPIDPAVIQKAHDKFLASYDSMDANREHYHERIDYWFDDRTIVELDKIYAAIKTIPNHDARRFYICAFSHNLKNSSRWLMKSIKPTIDKKKIITDPYQTFNRHLATMKRKNEEFYKTLQVTGNLDTSSKVYQTDSTKKWRWIKDNSVDLIVTSPPYVTSYEYADLHQLSLLWFGSDPTLFKSWHNRFRKEFVDFRRNFIGTSSKPKRIGSYGSKLADDIVTDLAELDRPLAEDVSNYFIDMKKVFSHMYSCLKPGGTAGVIIGNTKLRGVEIKNAEVAADQMLKAGFENVDYVKRELSNKMITPWRDTITGKFTGVGNANKHRVYEYEYVLLMRRPV